MKRLGRFIFDAIGGVIGLVGVLMSMVVLTGGVGKIKVMDEELKAIFQHIKLLKETEGTQFWFGIIGLGISAFVMVLSLIAMLLVFRAKSHLTFTIIIYVLGLVAVGLAAYAIYKYVEGVNIKDVKQWF